MQPVFDRYYADADEPLVLLVIDPDRLGAEVRVEPVGDDTYPHVYGPIEPGGRGRGASARPGQAASFLPTFFLTFTSLRFLTV